MHNVTPYPLWLGHAGDGRALRAILDAGISALVDLAAMEPPPPIPRDLIYCRFPLVDGQGNAAGVLRAAIETTARLLQSRTPTLVFCSAGMSRSPAIAAAALAVVNHQTLDECLKYVTRFTGCDVSPGLWNDVRKILAMADAPRA
jgi:protein-tyrosine phosphatase